MSRRSFYFQPCGVLCNDDKNGFPLLLLGAHLVLFTLFEVRPLSYHRKLPMVFVNIALIRAAASNVVQHVVQIAEFSHSAVVLLGLLVVRTRPLFVLEHSLQR